MNGNIEHNVDTLTTEMKDVRERLGNLETDFKGLEKLANERMDNTKLMVKDMKDSIKTLKGQQWAIIIGIITIIGTLVGTLIKG